MRRREKIFYTNENKNKVGVAIHLSDKIDIKTKTVSKDKEGYYIMIIHNQKLKRSDN